MIDLARTKEEQVLTGNDNIVIRKYIDGIEGGRDLDITDFKSVTGSTVLHAGHVIIKKDGAYKPFPVKKGEDDAIAYDSLPAGYTIAGILVSTIDATTHGAAIMTRGKVNKSDNVQPYSYTSILTALKAALPLIEFMEDGD